MAVQTANAKTYRDNHPEIAALAPRCLAYPDNLQHETRARKCRWKIHRLLKYDNPCARHCWWSNCGYVRDLPPEYAPDQSPIPPPKPRAPCLKHVLSEILWPCIYGPRDQLVIPYTLDANDMRFATAQGFNSGDQFYSYLKDSFDALYAEGVAGRAKMMSVGLHCRLIGRPGRVQALRRFIE